MITGNRTRTVLTLAVILGVLAVFSGSLHAVLVYEPFDYPAGEAIDGLAVNAIGLTGADGNTILAERRPLKNGIDYGYVGDVKSVNTSIIHDLLNSGLVPVFAAMTHDGNGQLFNTNADTIASSVAVGMANDFDVELNYCFELNGVLKDINDPESVIADINPSNYQELKEKGIINSGMIPKIDNAFDALSKGVKAVRIMNSQHIGYLAEGHKSVGTLIVN